MYACVYLCMNLFFYLTICFSLATKTCGFRDIEHVALVISSTDKIPEGTKFAVYLVNNGHMLRLRSPKAFLKKPEGYVAEQNCKASFPVFR